MAHVVVWSGGADSTALLYAFARTSSKAHPVRAFTVSDLSGVNREQFEAQRRAQTNMLRLMKRRGLHVVHDQVDVRRRDWRRLVNNQAIWWLAFVAPFVGAKDKVHFGYIRGDDFWHRRSEFVQLFDRMMEFGSREGAKIEFDLEWTSKQAVLGYLTKHRVPKACWWSCEGGRVATPCGTCNKCLELADPGHERSGSQFPYD